MNNVREEDIREVFIRASGPGGQNVNKVSSAVCLRHIPTGIQVKCQKYRTQYQNRVYARELLAIALAHRSAQEVRRKIEAREKCRRQERKRPRRLKEKILQLKKAHSEKKEGRKAVRYPSE